tara:strand:+ start:474 stop:635 length:162 start_codon:yes stop_codon:yes gene_type:complete
VCRKVTCRKCERATWTGCGLHVETVLKGIPKSQRCSCEKPDVGGFFSWLFGRS